MSYNNDARHFTGKVSQKERLKRWACRRLHGPYRHDLAWQRFPDTGSSDRKSSVADFRQAYTTDDQWWWWCCWERWRPRVIYIQCIYDPSFRLLDFCVRVCLFWTSKEERSQTSGLLIDTRSSSGVLTSRKSLRFMRRRRPPIEPRGCIKHRSFAALQWQPRGHSGNPQVDLKMTDTVFTTVAFGLMRKTATECGTEFPASRSYYCRQCAVNVTV